MAGKPDKADMLTVETVVEAFGLLLLHDKQAAMPQMQAALDADVKARRQQLIAELESLGGGPVIELAQPKPKKTWQEKMLADGDARALVKPMYRAPDGYEWSGRGAIPKVFKALGVTDKSGMEPYRIAE